MQDVTMVMKVSLDMFYSQCKILPWFLNRIKHLSNNSMQ